MLSIDKNVSCEYIIKKSKFICLLFRVDDVGDVKFYLDDLHKKYSDSTHICYAYIIDNVKRFSDDGEPGGTAGMPILNVLENNNLDHIMCCVVRYFGGIKLGAGGLVRAYTNSCTLALDKANVINLVKSKLYSITFNYDDTKIIDGIINNVFDKSYGEYVTYTFGCYDNDKIKELSKYSNICEIGECYIEKDF